MAVAPRRTPRRRGSGSGWRKPAPPPAYAGPPSVSPSNSACRSAGSPTCRSWSRRRRATWSSTPTRAFCWCARCAEQRPGRRRDHHDRQRPGHARRGTRSRRRALDGRHAGHRARCHPAPGELVRPALRTRERDRPGRPGLAVRGAGAGLGRGGDPPADRRAGQRRRVRRARGGRPAPGAGLRRARARPVGRDRGAGGGTRIRRRPGRPTRCGRGEAAPHALAHPGCRGRGRGARHRRRRGAICRARQHLRHGLRRRTAPAAAWSRCPASPATSDGRSGSTTTRSQPALWS